MAISNIPTWTLSRFLRVRERESGGTGELTELIMSISVAVKIISQIVSTAGFKGLYGYTGTTNKGGDSTAVLDREADEVLVQFLSATEHFGLLVSEERDEVVATDSHSRNGKYVVAFDPLDGSSNIGSNIPVGTIFTVWKRKDTTVPASSADFMQSGRTVVASGYSVYGAKTSFVYSVGQGVHGFTLDPAIGEFLLTEEMITTPKEGTIYSINESTYDTWSPSMQQFVNELKTVDEKGNPKYSARYAGSLVADFDRNLRKGGVFIHPATQKYPGGKLRMLYEVIPLAFIVDQAGGMATDGLTNILDIMPKDIHDRAPLIVGSIREVERYLEIARSRG